VTVIQARADEYATLEHASMPVLKSNRRIAALVTVICLALLIFCLAERQVRQALAEQGRTKIEGL
jgi:transposase